jgi:hypothetical protein
MSTKRRLIQLLATGHAWRRAKAMSVIPAACAPPLLFVLNIPGFLNILPAASSLLFEQATNDTIKK